MAKLVNERTREEYYLSGDVTVLGRLPTSDVRVLEKQVSRRHCRIVRSREGWVLSDSGSMIGTMLNGELLMRPTCLRDGDTVKVGTETFVFDRRGKPPMGKVHLEPLSAAAPGKLVPRDAAERRSRRLPVAIGAGIALVAIATLIAFLLIGRETPRTVVRRAAELARRRAAAELWELVSQECKKDLAFAAFKDYLDAVPEEALAALEALDVGRGHLTEQGMIVTVAIRVGEKRLTDEVVLFREDGAWRIHAAPIGRAAELVEDAE